MKRVFLALAAVITGTVFFSATVPSAAYAADASCDAYVFAMPA